jgi:hypothetical protein
MLAPRSSAAMMRMSQPFCSLVSHHLDHATFPAPATSNAACGFPRTTLSCLLCLKAYGTYPASATFGIDRRTR